MGDRSTAIISFAPDQQSGLEELGGSSPIAINAVVELNGVVRRRPGIAVASSAPTDVIDAAGLIGLHAFQDQLFAVGATVETTSGRPARRIYAVTAGGFVGVGWLPGTGRSVAAETEMLGVFAGGAEIVKVELMGFASADLGGAPPLATHVLANSSRLLANDLSTNRTQVRFSDTALGLVTYAGHEVWSPGVGTAGRFTAEARPDAVVAIGENTNEVFVWGHQTLEIWGPDGTTVYSRIAAFEYGNSAAYSVVKEDSRFSWLDERRRFVRSDGRSLEAFSQGIQRTLDGLSRVDDAFGYRVQLGPIDVRAWSFPSDGRTFAHQDGAGWGQWAGWDGSNWTPCPIVAATKNLSTGELLVATNTGRIGAVSFDAQTDLGAPIRMFVATGFQDRGTPLPKVTLMVTVTLRRGATSSTTAPVAWLGWRDTPNAPWKRVPVSLGSTGNREIVREFYSLGGTYRRRQWCFEYTGAEALSLVEVRETFEVLES